VIDDRNEAVIKQQLIILRGYVETVLHAIDAIGEMFQCDHPLDCREYLPTSRMGNLEWHCSKCNQTFKGNIEQMGSDEGVVVSDGSTHT